MQQLLLAMHYLTGAQPDQHWFGLCWTIILQADILYVGTTIVSLNLKENYSIQERLSLASHTPHHRSGFRD